MELPRPNKHLFAASKHYPNAWQQVNTMMAGRGHDLPDWPQWCFLPMSAWYSIVCAENKQNRLNVNLVGDVARLAAIGTWRYGQSIYQIDPALMAVLMNTTLTGDIPCEVLYRLPEFAVYIETPGMQWLGSECYGFWAHLEFDINTQRTELRLLMDTEADLAIVILHIGKHTLTEAVDRAMKEAARQASLTQKLPMPMLTEATEVLSNDLQPFISLLLYVCSEGVQYTGHRRPSNAPAKKTKKGWKLFAPPKPRYWELGKQIGNQLRKYESDGHRVAGRTLSPHIRRAHWHLFWKGLRGEQSQFIKFLPPIFVAGESKN
ncbi:hypothetical protein [Reinekea sp. G2M2-21]|uniref:AcrVA2 family anti-CRISPR protein n=1 Tax=Reinekea sp. G2M2-21 TaxID=2788942 RepID=UPI0018AC4CB6|nr:hypothetical protein [Reinekea sp. G2M2-21]